jgi:hypothetical protein
VLSIPGAPLTVAPNSLVVATSLGTALLATRIAVAGMAVPASFGSPTFAGGGITVTPTALVVAVSFGTPGLAFTVNFASSESPLNPAVTFGTPTLDLVVVALTVYPAALTVAVTFGSAVLPGPPLVSEPGGILVGATGGSVRLDGGSGVVRLDGGAAAMVGSGRRLEVANGAGKVATHGPARVRL